MHALITGATGFVGRQLALQFESPAILTRHPQSAAALLPHARAFAWDPVQPPPEEAFEGVDAVFHLAGEPIATGRWTAAKKAKIHDSRAVGTRLLAEAMAKLKVRPKVLVSCSAIGIYGNRGDTPLPEHAPPASGFLSQVCQAWELGTRPASDAGMRVAIARFGLVLGPKGGPLSAMLTPFKLGLGGRLGSGRQWMSWVHVEDAVGAMLHLAERPNVCGPANIVAPGPVTNREFTKTLASVLHRPAVFPMPGLMLKLIFGAFGQVLLDSQRVVPDVLMASGYAFKFPELRQALEHCVKS